MRGTSLPGGDPGEGSAEAIAARDFYLPRFMMGFRSWLIYRVIYWLWIRFKGCFILDVRSIAFYRILMGCTLIGDLIDRGRDLIFHYSDEGLNPRNLVFEKLDDASYSIYFINGTPAVTLVIWIIHGIICFFMLIGWHTKLSSFLVFFLHNSLISRNIWVSHGGENLLRAALFWTLFLPLGKCYSVDNLYSDKKWKKRQTGEARSYQVENGSKGKWSTRALMGRLWTGTKSFFWEGLQTPTTDSPQGKKFNVFNAAAIASVVQVSFLYGFSVVHKTGDSWGVTGNAVQLALGLDFFRLPMGDFLLTLEWMFPGLLYIMGKGTLYLEEFGFYFLFSPIFSEPCRILGSIGYIAMHFGFAITLRLATFFWVPFAVNAMLLPGMFWDYFVFSFLRTPSRLNLRVRYHPSQDKLARVLGMLCLLRETEIRRINEEEARSWMAEDQKIVDNSEDDTHVLTEADPLNGAEWVVRDSEGRFYTDDSAMILILSNSVLPLAWLVAYFIERFPSTYPRLLSWFRRDKKKHNKMKKKKQERGRILNRPESRVAALRNKRRTLRKYYRVSWVVVKNGTVLAMLYLTLIWNMANVGLAIFPWEYHGVMAVTGLQQMWDMFSPNPPSLNNWPVVEVVMYNDSKLELFGGPGGLTAWEGRPMTFDPPSPFPAAYKNHRGYKYIEALLYSKDPDLLSRYAEYVCDEWNKRHITEPDALLKEVSIFEAWRWYSFQNGVRLDFDVNHEKILYHECVLNL